MRVCAVLFLLFLPALGFADVVGAENVEVPKASTFMDGANLIMGILGLFIALVSISAYVIKRYFEQEIKYLFEVKKNELAVYTRDFTRLKTAESLLTQSVLWYDSFVKTNTNIPQLESAIFLTEHAHDLLQEVSENELKQVKFFNAHVMCNLGYYYAEYVLITEGKVQEEKEKRERYKAKALLFVAASNGLLEDLKMVNYRAWHNLKESQLHIDYFLRTDDYKTKPDESDRLKQEVKEMLGYVYAKANPEWTAKKGGKWGPIVADLKPK